MSLITSLMISPDNIFNPFRGLFTENYMDIQMDWKETSYAHVFEIDLPGLTREDVKLEVHQGKILHISAERRDDDQEPAEDNGDYKWHCRERTHGIIMREFRLPENAKVNEIKASMHDGVLVVTVPVDHQNKNKAKQHKASVEISGDDHDDDQSHVHTPKGLGRFVCCKA
ncbi:hypothetical protein Ddye_014332 [Dipteronia dyeriana]|uniref:SHSP domain-containing protein n=1 Tax=Dipteronia dyeriana TaxID=168575 RepID=A0AAE0CKI1_9ROSI|nr:hypothetical protein Ddye_014332 [Dipteronia dyeriana]